MPTEHLLGQARFAPPNTSSRFRAESEHATDAPAGSVSIDGYGAGDWPVVRDFIAKHWRSDHPLLDRGLFGWQYRGFGPRVGTQDIRLIRVAGELVGFLGLIPGLYFREGRTVEGAAIALWVVRPDLRDRGLGALALREAKARHDVLCCVGINPSALPLYQKLGFAQTPALVRWAAVLNRERAGGLSELLRDAPSVECDAIAAPIEQWDFERLAALYQRTVMTQFRVGLARTIGYWRWRYASSAGYSYRLFDGDGGFVVARVERVIAPGTAADRCAILRLIEILPTHVGAWDGAIDEAGVRLIRGVLAWGAERGCVLADYQHCSARLGPLLEAAGMTSISPQTPWSAGVPNLFQPLRASAAPLNAAWCVRSATPIGADDLYLVKSDGDMDRPNVWPLPLEYVD